MCCCCCSLSCLRVYPSLLSCPVPCAPSAVPWEACERRARSGRGRGRVSQTKEPDIYSRAFVIVCAGGIKHGGAACMAVENFPLSNWPCRAVWRHRLPEKEQRKESEAKGCCEQRQQRHPKQGVRGPQYPIMDPVGLCAAVLGPLPAPPPPLPFPLPPLSSCSSVAAVSSLRFCGLALLPTSFILAVPVLSPIPSLP